MIFYDEYADRRPKLDRNEVKGRPKTVLETNLGHEIGKIMVDTLKNAICDEVKRRRPWMTEDDVFKGINDGKIKLTYARSSNWPFGKPYIPPVVEFLDKNGGILSE